MGIWEKVIGFLGGLRNYNLVPAKPVAAPHVDHTSPVSQIPDSVVKQGWSKSLSDCHERIRSAYPLVEAEFCASNPGCSLKCDYTYRSPEFQFELYKKGRKFVNGEWVVEDKDKIVTTKDGKKPSHHNVYPSQAVDVYVVRYGQIVWKDDALYTKLGGIWVKRGLIAGATWKFDWKDWPHVQVDYKIL